MCLGGRSAERSAAWHPGTRKGTRDPRRNPGGGGGGRERRGWGARCSLRSFSHARARRWSRAAGFPDYGIRELKQRGRLPARSGCGKLRWRISKERGRYPGSRRRQLPLPTPAEAGTGAGWWRSKETLKPLGTHLPIGIDVNGTSVPGALSISGMGWGAGRTAAQRGTRWSG